LLESESLLLFINVKMFQSCEWKYLDSDPKTDQFRYEVTIVDDDFIEVAAATTSYSTAAHHGAAGAALIDIYSRRNLNVAGNLALLMQYIEHKWVWSDIKWQIEWYQKYIPEYQKYHDQVMGYLAFS